MELSQLRYFCAVVAAGSFTRAAESEGITQPSLSQQISRLELSVGAPLFLRLGRQIRLTPAGEALHFHALEILRHTREASGRIRHLAQSACGPLRVGVIPTVLPYLIAPHLSHFTSLYPDVQLELREDVTPELVKQLRKGDIDVMIAVLPLRIPEIICSELVRDPLVLSVRQGHPLAANKSADIRVLQHERLLLLREGHCFRDDVLTVCTRARAEFHAYFESDSLATIFSLVAGGMGVSIVPAMAASHSSGCVFLPLNEPKMRRVGLARLRSSGDFKPLRAFIGWLRNDVLPSAGR